MFEHHCAELDTGMLSNINLLKGKNTLRCENSDSPVKITMPDKLHILRFYVSLKVCGDDQ